MSVFLQDLHWLFSLVVHFREWLLVLCLIPVLSFFWTKRYITPILGIIIFIFHFIAVYPHWGIHLDKTSGLSSSKNEISIFYANINSNNKNKEQLINHLKALQPNIALLVEFNSAWAKKVKDLKNIYPYTQAIVREGNFGMAILSKSKIEIKNIYVDKENLIPAMHAKVQINNESIDLVLLHAHPPIGKYATLIRDQYLTSISRNIYSIEGPLLVCGDFNTTPWTSTYKKIIKNSGLNSATNFNTPSTWPSSIFLPSLPIDHCLVKGFNFVKYQKGPDIGSDHWPLWLSIKASHRDLASH